MIPTEIPITPAQKDKAVENAVKLIEREHGKGAIIRMDDRIGQPIPSIPTGIFSLDYNVLQCGGFPRGRIIEIYGPEAGGKTTLALLAVASAQCANERAAFIDVEHALDPTWMSLVGVKVADLLISQPDYGEQALQILEVLLESNAFGIIITDSVAALVPKAELDGEIGDAMVGVQARMMSQACRKLNALIARSGCVLVFINQIREKIGVMFGNPETTTGGRALKFYSSVRLDVRRIGQVKHGDQNVGNRVRIKAAKNKVGVPFRECEVDLLFDRGFDVEGDLFDNAVSAGLVEKSGSWFSMSGEQIGQGRTSAIEHLRSTNRFDELRNALRARGVKGVTD